MRELTTLWSPTSHPPTHHLHQPSIVPVTWPLFTYSIFRLLNYPANLTLNLPHRTLNPVLRLLLQHLLLASPLMVLHEPISLRELSTLIDEMAEEEEIVLRLDGERVSHEGCGVDC